MIIIKDEISSRANETVKMLASLQTKKGRESSRLFMVEGVKLTDEVIRCALPVEYIILSKSRSGELMDKYTEMLSVGEFANAKLLVVSDGVFEKISTEKAPQGVISIVKYLDIFDNLDIIYKEEIFLSPNEKAMLLCSVRDPSNLGAIIRSAAAFGVDRLILSSDCADVYNPKTLRSAMGSLFKIKISFVSDLASFILGCREVGRRVFSAELNPGAMRADSGELTDKDLIVIGNEGHGVSREVSEACDRAVYIPICDGAESLNAAVAASVLMWIQFK